MGSTVFPALTSLVGPANSDIATAVAGAVPTISAINTSVASNASPFPNYTSISNTSWNGTTSITVSGLSSYKRLYIWYTFCPNSVSDITLRFNSDTADNYHHVYINNGDSMDGSITGRVVLGYNSYTNQTAWGSFIIDNVSSTNAPKLFSGWAKSTGDGNRQYQGVYNSNSAISSLIIAASANVTASKLFILGV